jgi:SAM-dependent methyltransferase
MAEEITQHFMYRTLRRLLDRRRIALGDRILVVCAGPVDRDVLGALGFRDVVLSTLDAPTDDSASRYASEDAERLTFDDDSFDVVMVHMGLHHCRSPHAGLLEMHRTARKAVIVFENQDSLLMRLFVKLRLSADYELDAVELNGMRCGGVRNSSIPNYVYRWTRRDFEKTVRTVAPDRIPAIQWTTRFHFNEWSLEGRLASHPVVRLIGAKRATLAFRAFVHLLNVVASRQGNLLCAIVWKRESRLQPWMEAARSSVGGGGSGQLACPC